MLDQINHFIEYNKLLTPSTIVVLGLSGGPDSVFLLHMLAQKKRTGAILNVIAAHLDHGWRVNSEKDIEFCQTITQKLGVSFVHQKLSDLALPLKFNGSQEEVGRRARRFFLEQVREQVSADAIALAHHAQDQEETFFIRLFRGASVAGLAAMRPRSGHYIRPLLTTNKTDIVAFLDTHHIPYLTDPTNAADAYLRNRIRNHVIPGLEQCDQRFHTKFMDTITNLQLTEDFLTRLTHEQFAAIAHYQDGVWHINIQLFLKLDSIFHHRMLVHWFCLEQVKFSTSTAFFEEVMRFLRRPAGGTHAVTSSWKLCKRRGIVFIIR
jgi:tRNA(Ile)-lysidine synthase